MKYTPLIILRYIALLLVGILLFQKLMYSHRYEIDDVSKTQIFRPFIKKSKVEGYVIHVEGELDGNANVCLFTPEYDPSNLYKEPFMNYYRLDSGKVDKKLIFSSSSFEGWANATLFYQSGTAKKGHLKIRLSI